MNKQITAAVLDENGNECQQTFFVEREFTVADKPYLALIPADDDDLVYLFAFTKEGDDVTLLEIEDDEEYDRVADAYEHLMGE